MELKERLDGDLKAAMKARDELKLSTVRMLKSAINNGEISKKKVFTDEDVVSVISTSIKQRKDSIEQYTKGGRNELAAREEAEMKILLEYLPAQLNEEEVRALVVKAITETSGVSAKDMGKVMGRIMPSIKGKADSSLVSSIVKELLK